MHNAYNVWVLQQQIAGIHGRVGGRYLLLERPSIVVVVAVVVVAIIGVVLLLQT